METYVKPKVSIVLAYKSIKGGHISVALKKTQKWKVIFNKELDKYILANRNVKIAMCEHDLHELFE